MNANKFNKRKILTIITFAVFLAILVLTLVFVKNPMDNASAAYPDWCGEYKVALSLSDSVLKQEETLRYDNGYVSNLAIADIVCGIPDGVDAKDVKVRVRTKDGTAVAGVDYTAVDTIVTLRRSYFTGYNPRYYYDIVTVKVDTTVERMIVDGIRPYFDIELYDVLDEGFTIADNAKSVRIYVASEDSKEHYYTTDNAYNTKMFHEYLDYDHQGSSNLDIYSEDKSGQTLSASQGIKLNESPADKFSRDYKRTGLADYFLGVNLHLDEKGVYLSSWCYLDLYDGNTSGTHLYHGEFHSIWNDSLYPGIYYEDMDHRNESFADSPNSFKDESESSGRPIKAYYFRVSSGTIYETFKSNSDYWRKTKGWNLYWIVVDDTAPQITGWYIDKSTVQKGDKIRISVRFNEPVNASASDLNNLKLRTIFNGSGGFNNYHATFDCVTTSGSTGICSNVLTFEFNPSTALDAYNVPLVGTINSIEIEGFDNLNKVKDYGRNTSNSNNFCGNYTTLSSLEGAKMAPRQLRSDMTINFDNRSPVVDQQTEITNSYVKSFNASVVTTGSTKLQGVYYLWSTIPDLNYEKVATPVDGEIANYYEYKNDEIVKTSDLSVVGGKTYFIKRAFNLAKAYETIHMSNANTLSIYNDIQRYKEFTDFEIEYSKDGNFATTLAGVSGTYYLHVYAKSIYSDDVSTFRRFGPIKIDDDAPVFANISATEDLQEKTVTATVDELSGLANVIVYLRETGFDVDDATYETKKILIYGTTDDDSVIIPDPNCQTIIDLEHNSISFILKAVEHVGLEDGVKSYGDYYIGLVGTDLVGNTSTIVSSATQASFDLRDQFAPYVKIGGIDVTDSTDDRLPIIANTTFYAENAYVVDISSGPVTIQIGRPGNIDGAGGYYLTSVIHYENNFRVSLQIDAGAGTIASATKTYLNNYVINENSYTDPYVSFDVLEPGYYEVQTVATYVSKDYYSRTQRFYVTNGNETSNTKNYNTIYNVGVNFKNKLFTLSTGRYYSRTGTGMGSSVSTYYNNSVEPLVFSSKEKASAYVKMMEYCDFYAIRITNDDIQAYNNGTLVTERGETRRPEVGDVWIRYKATTWNFSTNQRDWVYYYYGDTSVNTTIDVGQISGRLASAIDQIVQLIVGKGTDLYLTSLAGQSENGALYVDPVRLPSTTTITTSVGIPSTNLTYTGSLTNPLVYEFDTDVFYDKYNDQDNVKLISAYKFTQSNSTKIYYAEAKYDIDKNLIFDMSSYKDDFTLLKTSYLTQSATKSGKYIIRELDETGMHDYVVYVDLDTPTIHGTYAGIDADHTMHYNQWWTKDKNEGETLYTTSFTLALVEDKPYSSDIEYNDYHGFGLDADTYSYVAIFNITDGVKKLQASFSLHDLTSEDRTYEFPYGVFIVEVYDRAGNGFYMNISVARSDLTSTIEVIKDDKITFTVIDRIPTELEKVYVARPGYAMQEVDFATEAVVTTDIYGNNLYSLVYTDSGRYEFMIVDKYGYTLSPSTDPDVGKVHTVADLIRVNPYENVKWVTRTDDGRFVDLDAENISLFHSDTYYITSDDKLTFVLDSTTIYSYTFTGNVSYQAIERTINNKKYIYVNVDSTERWSVRIYYTLYPNIAVTYNRVAKVAVVPAAIDLRPLEKDSAGIAQADQTNRIVVYVGTQDEIVDNIIVHLRTRDRSAIASLGDYDAYEGTVTLTPTNKEQMVVIQTHPSGFSTYNSSTYVYANRTFDFYIESIEGNAEKGKSAIECACPGEQELNIVTKDGIQVFEVYTSGDKHGLPNIAMEHQQHSSSGNRYYDFTNSFTVNQTWLTTYVSSGLANLYIASELSLSGDDIDDYPKLRLTLAEESQNKQLFRIYVKKVDDNKNVVFGKDYKGLKTSGETYDTTTALNISESRGNAIAAKYFLAPSNTNGIFSLNIHEDEGMYTIYYSDGQGGVYSEDVYVLPARNVNDPFGYSLLVDTTAPTIKSWHIDHSTIRFGENLRLSVRFSEPVYIAGGSNPYVNATVAGTAQTISFEYAGGAGTDTLYFEFNPSAYTTEINVSAISLQYMGNQSNICDYAYNVSKRNNALGSFEMPRDTEWDNSCALDTRIPVISMDSGYYISSNPQRNATVPIEVSKTTNGAVLEYSWTVESDAPAMYDKQLTLTSVEQKIMLEAKGFSGVYYLHIYMQSVYGKVSTRTYGPFLFDNSFPVFSGLNIEEATKGLKERNVVFYVNDEPSGKASSGLAQVYMYYLFKGEDTPQTVKLYDVNQDEKRNIISISENNRVVFLLNYETLGMLKEEQKDVTIAFYAVDGLGNAATISSYTFYPTIVNFDARSEVEVTLTSSKDAFFNADNIPVFNIAGGSPRFDVSFSRQADEYDINHLYIGGKEINPSKYNDYLEYTANIDGVHMQFKSSVVGVVRVNFKAITGTGDNHTVQESSDIVFYLTNGTDKSETYNYLATGSGTLFINKVYMLDAPTYYYHNGEGVRQKNYNDTTKQVAFSSRDKAVEYVKFYEMQDLGIFEIKTTSQATALNTGDGSYRKAALDASVTASVGQVWVRYKRATWDNATTSDAWVYYYLGTSSEIDPERLTNSLSTAIAQVTETIVNKGGYVYLTSGNDGLDANGAPYLDKKQIVLDRLTLFVTLAGAELRNAITFEGDPGIYNSRVTPAGEDEPCSLVTTYNFEYSQFTKIFYTNQMDASGAPISREFKLLPQGTVFGSLNIDGGVYWIRECDETGVRDYKVYLDKTAPTINVTYKNAKGDSIDRELDAAIDGMTINGKVLTIKGFSSTATEIDTMAYIAVFKKNGVLVNVYRKEDIPAAGIEVGEGQYYLEISDRSGNSYKVYVSLNSTPLEVKVTAEENRYVRITCNRDASEIKMFEIYLDNKLLESNYSASVTYYQSGIYSIRIEDWFGNSYYYDYELKRELPKISWYYMENDNYIAYDGSQSCLKISKTAEREYTIITNKQLMFMFDTSEEYVYEFHDGSISTTAREFNGKTRVNINDATDWKLTVKYSRYPEIYIVYTCLMDQTAPIINVTARQDVVKYYDQQQVEEANLAESEEPKPEFFVPNNIYFGVTKTISKAVRNNSTIYSTLLTFSFDDKSICSEVEIYLDGVMIREYREAEGVNNITINRFGEYRIVARDTLGNQSEFTFANYDANKFKFIVDGKEKDIKLSPADAITYENGEYNYPADVYAFENVEFMYGGSGKIVFLVERDNDKKYLAFESINGALYEVAYRLIRMTDEEGNPLYDDYGNEVWVYQYIYYSTVVPDMSAVEAGKSFILAEEDKAGVTISVRFDEYKNVYYHVDAPKDAEATVTMRIAYNSDYQPYFTKTIMSGELPKVTFELTSDEVVDKQITPTSTEQIVYLNGGFFVAETAFKNITEVSIAYSKTREFANYQIIYDLNNGYEKVVFTEEGFYSVIAKNIYGRISEYIVTMSNELKIIVTTDFADGYSVQHAVTNGSTYKSNEKVTIDVYTEWIEVYVLLNNLIPDAGMVLGENGICSITWSKVGTYHLTVRDQFQNEITIDFVIEDKPFEFKLDYLTGYNEDALRKDEGYSNKKLSVNAQKMLADGIRQVSVVYEGVETVVFDILKDYGALVIPQRLTDVIGSSGDGVYTLKMRNENGNVAEKALHYMGSNTLRVSRLIRTSRDPEAIEFVEGDGNQVYSNYSVTFETRAGIFDIRVDGDKADMPLTLRYPSDVEDVGEYKRTVTYVDEYGFKYSFVVNLVRKQLEIDLEKLMKVVVIGDAKMTRDNVAIEYPEGVTCVYTLDGGNEMIPYTSGAQLSKDGTYRFYITDVAGNVQTALIKKDTMVEYTFLYTGTDKVVENGSVIMSGSARFAAVNKDSAKIDLAVLNGVEYVNAAGATYGDTGKWEFIISDDIGNKSYYYFYVVPNALSKFEYESPYDYKITNLEFDGGDGILISYINLVKYNVNKNNSEMVFNETGTYQVTVSSVATSSYFTFSVIIDKTPPQAKLVGAEDGSTTIANVSLSDCQVGDVIRIYKDGDLSQEIVVTSNTTKMPEINEKGDYKIVITNAAGNEQVFEFTRKYTANVPTTIVVIVVCLLVSIGLMVVLFLRKRKKV